MAHAFGITAREYEVLRLTAAGLQHKQVARHLGTREHTVTNQLTRLFAKCGVTSSVQLAVWALRHRVLTFDDLDGVEDDASTAGEGDDGYEHGPVPFAAHERQSEDAARTRHPWAKAGQPQGA